MIQDVSGSWCIKGTGEPNLVMDSPVFLMHHDPDRSWITDPDPDHPKGAHPKITLNITVIQLKYILFGLDLKTTHAHAQKENFNTLLL